MKVGGLALGILIASACWALAGCGDDDSSGGDAGTDTDTDTDTDADADGGADAGDGYGAEILWAKRSGADHTEHARGVAVLSDSSLFAVGWFTSETVFGEGEATETFLTSESSGGSDMFLARYGSEGSFQWVRHAAVGSAADAVELPDGNIAVVGGFFTDFLLGEGEENETSLIDDHFDGEMFLAVYEPDGALAWAKSIEGSAAEYAKDIVVSADGSIYLAGSLYDSIVFGPGEETETVLVSQGGYDVFLAKYSGDGALLWARSAGGAGDDTSGSISVATDGAIWIAGGFGEPITFAAGEPEETTLTSAGEKDAFVARYGAEGALQWAVRAGGTTTDEAWDAAAADDGAAVIAGTFSGNATFGEGSENELSLGSNGGNDAFFARYGADGSLAWVMAAGGAGEDAARGVAAAADGSAVIVGAYTESMSFEDTGATAIDLSSATGYGTFAAKVAEDGRLVWITRMEFYGGEFSDTITGLDVEIAPDESTYLFTRFTGECTIGVGDPGEASLTVELGDNPFPGAADLLLIKIAP